MTLPIFRGIEKAALALVALCALLIGAASPAYAQTANIRAELLLETAQPRAGDATMAAIRMTPNAGWHGYWLNGGDAGFGMTIDWNLPDGVIISPVQYPVPEALILFGMMNHVYEHPYALLAEVRVADTVPAGTDLTISGIANWLACTDKVCVPEQSVISAKMVAGDGRIDAKTRDQFDIWRAALPRPLASEGKWERIGDVLRLSVPLPENVAVSAPHLFMASDGVADYAAPQSFSRRGDQLIVEWKAKGQAANDAARTFEGLLKIADGQGFTVTFASGDVPAAGKALAATSDTGGFGLFWAAMAGAVLGGLILNLMPCVFPILSLKALSLARSGGDGRAARVEAIAYTVGAVVTAALLGAVLLVLRASGEQIGWAFQLQHPASVMVLLLLAAAITANLAGLFHLPSFGGGDALARQGGVAGGFWTGALAAFVATPCSGPMLGAALGATLALPAWAAMPVFAALGFGLALPFLAIAYIPALRRNLPKPGPWMDRFRKIMAVPMALTVAALIWLLWRQIGNAALLVLPAVSLVAMVAALALWGKGRGALAAGLALVSLGAAGYSATILDAAQRPQSGDGRVYSEEALRQARAEGKAVFLYFTADWCLSCKANEAGAINRAAVQQAMRDADVEILVADWTNGDAHITRKLEEFGRNSVPLYLWYPPKALEPEILPQILTPAMLIKRASDAGAVKGQK
jgi:thiol:disulfide interchange protein